MSRPGIAFTTTIHATVSRQEFQKGKMKVNPLNEEEQPRTEEQSTLRRVVSFVWSSSVFFGFLPFHQNKRDHTFSFKFFSFTTIFTFARLVLFNFPFTFLPIILFLNFGGNELEQEQFEALLGIGNGTTTTATMLETTLRVDYIIGFTLFILSELQKI